MHRGLASIGRNNRNMFGSVFMPNVELPTFEIQPELSIQTLPQGIQQHEPQSLADIILPALASANPICPELQARKAAIFAEASEAVARWDEFLKAAEQERTDDLTTRHREIREKGREQLALCGKLAGEFAAADEAWNKARSVQAHAINGVTQAIYNQRSLGRFASDAQINQAAVRVADAERAAEKASQAHAAAMQFRNETANREVEAQKELSAIAAQETRLRAALTGTSFIDPETGLSVPAGA